MAAGPSVLRDDMAQARRQMAERAYTIALQAAGKLESATLRNIISQGFKLFSSALGRWLIAWRRQAVKRRELLHDLDQLVRLPGPEGRSSHATLSQLVRERDDLDFQWAMQNVARW